MADEDELQGDPEGDAEMALLLSGVKDDVDEVLAALEEKLGLTSTTPARTKREEFTFMEAPSTP